MAKKEKPKTITYFIDEGGDLTLFNKRGQSMLGTNGVSRFFAVAIGYVEGDPEAVDEALRQLRIELCSDPALNGIPSMSPEAGKTAVFFHAKNDHALVRDRVFSLLPKLGMRVLVAFRRKEKLIAEGRDAARYGRKLTDNAIYDDLLKRLVRNRLHIAQECTNIYVARRGTKDRKIALLQAVDRAKGNFSAAFGPRDFATVNVELKYPVDHGGLQVIDYYLWALGRLLERGDEKYYRAHESAYRLIMDLDDTRNAAYGEWYHSKKPLKIN